MTDPTRPGGDTADSDVAAVHGLTVDWIPSGGITTGLRDPLADLPTFAVHDDNRPASDTDRRLWVGTFETDEPLPRVDLRQTDLHWGEDVSTDATRTGSEVGIPVRDDDGRELGEMRLSYANAGVLGAMLTDAADQGAPVDMTQFDELLNEYTRISAKAFAASRLTDAAGDPIYSDYQDWYQNGDWHAASEEGDPR